MKFFLLVLTLFIQSAQAQKTSPKEKPFFMKITEKWEIQSTDNQIFALRTEDTSYGPMESVSFSFGDREMTNLPISKKKFSDWKGKLVGMSQRLPASEDCVNPIRFKNYKAEKLNHTKPVCLEKLTATEREAIQKLTEEMNDYLYAK